MKRLVKRLGRLFAGSPSVQEAEVAWRRDEADLRSQFAAHAESPRGLRWSECEWSEDVRLVRERATGQLVAFAGVVVRFEAIEGDEMEDVPAVSMPRDATAVFHYRDDRWNTSGRVLFNMTPDEAASRLADQFEPADAS